LESRRSHGGAHKTYDEREVHLTDILILCGFSFLAGLVDSVAGGGGLIQLPALLVVLPDYSLATLFGTNKLSSICGTSIASVQYARHVGILWKATLPATIAALIFSFLGARTVSLIDPDIMRPLVLFLLLGIVIYTFIRKDFGSFHVPKLAAKGQLIFSILTGTVIGFYDGFFGPGTGSFLIFVFISLFGFSFLAASTSAKIVNFTTNLSALLFFVFTDNVLYKFALPMAVCNIAGSLVGTKLAILKGNRFVRILFMVVISGLILKLAYDTLGIRYWIK
jgi:uncharacterized protein